MYSSSTKQAKMRASNKDERPFYRFNLNKEKDDRYLKYYTLLEEYRQIKEQPVRFFNKEGEPRNIIDYVRDSVDRMNEYSRKPAYKDEWQNNIFDPITRGKLISILAIIASSRLKGEIHIKPRSIFHTKRTKMRRDIIADLLEDANTHNGGDLETIWEMFTAMSEGTVIGFEGFRYGAREVEFVKEFDPDTGEFKTEKEKSPLWDDVYGEIVPIEEFFPETIWTHDFKSSVHRCFRVKEMTMTGILDEYAGYPNVDKVKPASYYTNKPNFEWGISESISGDNVQVTQFFDEVADKMGIWANGVELYWGPLPWNHKRLPFWVAQFEPIHNQLLFGKSLPDKLMSMQDINNAVFNNLLDQLFMILNSPIFVDGDFDLDDGFLEPKRIYQIEAGSRMQKASLGNVDPQAFNVLSMVKGSIEQSSISAQAQGIPTGGRKTKYEVQSLNEGAMQLASLFLQLFEKAVSDKQLLRVYNKLQYESIPNPNRGEDLVYKFFDIETKLTNGQKGRRWIQIVEDESDIPSKEEQIKMVEQNSGKEFDVLASQIQPVYITREWLLNRNFEMEMKIVPNSSVKENEIQKRNNDIAFYQIANQDPRYNQNRLAEDLVQAFGKDDGLLARQDPSPAGIPDAAQQSGLPGMPGMRGQAAGGNIPQGSIDLDEDLL